MDHRQIARASVEIARAVPEPASRSPIIAAAARLLTVHILEIPYAQLFTGRSVPFA